VGIIGARVHLDPSRSFFAAIAHWFKSFFFPSSDALAYIDAMIGQMDFIRERIGVDHISLGMDGDGFVGLPFKNYAEMADHLRARMANRGDPSKHNYTPEEIDKIFAGNWIHVLKRKEEVLEARAKNGTEQTSIEDMLSPLNKYFPLAPPRSGIRHGPMPKLHPGVLDTIR
jgi:microsomal dipeptidase-like Zn-dependent dipeptidase